MLATEPRSVGKCENITSLLQTLYPKIIGLANTFVLTKEIRTSDKQLKSWIFLQRYSILDWLSTDACTEMESTKHAKLNFVSDVSTPTVVPVLFLSTIERLALIN